jgi:hypothetical protein
MRDQGGRRELSRQGPYRTDTEQVSRIEIVGPADARRPPAHGPGFKTHASCGEAGHSEALPTRMTPTEQSRAQAVWHQRTAVISSHQRCRSDNGDVLLRCEHLEWKGQACLIRKVKSAVQPPDLSETASVAAAIARTGHSVLTTTRSHGRDGSQRATWGNTWLVGSETSEQEHMRGS